ncbi:MAG TPA: putative baseplate assembly protein [Pyrinomonadaceae bacterium]|nr:putative baseplate assembly protein [Pyrinomonadaceae bacterium]
MIYFCCDERRRHEVRDPASGLNGIDFLEVLDAAAPVQSERQRKLFVHFLKDLTPGDLTANNFLIAGGERIRGIKVIPPVELGTGTQANVLTIEVDQPGDFSIYTLRLVQDANHAHDTDAGGGEPPAGFDPVLSSVPFSFKVECPSDFDCRPQRVCPPGLLAEPEIDYLAKDYNSFRQLMLDRMSVLLPQWRERNAADVGIALVELLAYVGDHLSYQQDVIATEAYLDTARRRVSVRRHARLVDYPMHDGCNARAWVQVQVDSDNVLLKRGTRLLTRVAALTQQVVNPNTDQQALRQINAAQFETFETMVDVTLFEAHNEIEFYTWGEERCCLPVGATQATLKGSFPDLQPGDVLVFEEVLGPLTGFAADADPAHRHAVRLTKINREIERENGDKSQLTDPLTKQEYVEIEWHTDDALPFALCVSARTEDSEYLPKVSVARGNIVLADHGRTHTESLGFAPDASSALATVAPPALERCADNSHAPVPPRFRPRLTEQPLTQAAPLNAFVGSQSQTPLARNPSASASAAFRWEMRAVLPAVKLTDTSGGLWSPQRDLLSSDAFAEEFVAEVDEDGRATLRFGDDQYGLRPTPGLKFTATYRVGNGVRGNIGAESLAHILTDDSRVTSVRNPMPARGGKEPESIEHVRRVAPSAFRILERAVTPEDYAEVAGRHREVQRAAATVRWTGSWRTIFLTVDRLGGRPVDAEFEQDLRLHLERYRMAGHDIEIDGPQFVPLEIEMTVCVEPSYFRGDVKAALLQVFSNTTLPDGQPGIFNPDKFSFGQPVYLSALYQAAQQVDGVRFVEINKFQRLAVASSQALDEGLLAVGRLEIARLDNDPNFPERGVLRLNMEGGR